MEQTKSAMRQAMRARRRALALDDQNAAAAAVSARLLALQAFREAPALIAYWATDGELRTETLLAAAAAAGKPLYLPRVDAGAIRFAAYRLGAPLGEGRFGIPEPQSEPLDAADLTAALALVPLVAFDAVGGRVGRGGGFYDRAFTAPHRPRWLIGVGYAFQQVDHVPCDPWDVRLDAVLAERATIICRMGGAMPQLRKEDRDDHEHHHVDTGQLGAGGRSGLRAGRLTAPAI
jgi:5-formyltetrahydrofolate cyclo-ligase